VVRPFLEYFELMDRGISFLTLKDPWCVPMLVGTGILEWLQTKGARSPREGAMFRGMSGSEYSCKLHAGLELYERLDLPCFNPLLDFTKEEIIEVIQSRYGLPLNPIYEHMSRTYCICCYTSDQRRQAYSAQHHPEVCARYYGQIENMLFDSGLMEQSHLAPEYRTKEEKLYRHGFVHWHRAKAQDIVGAVKWRLADDTLVYRIREIDWIDTKHLRPVAGRWTQNGSEIRLWGVPERQADILIRRMINCLNCGFCMVECFPCRRFDRQAKTLRIDGCVQCGKCLRLKFCMGWQHRFWRRTIAERP
jgi:ferredoxin